VREKGSAIRQAPFDRLRERMMTVVELVETTGNSSLPLLPSNWGGAGGGAVVAKEMNIESKW